MKQEEIIGLAVEAGFGCDCKEDCAYHILVSEDLVLLPKTSGTEALERFEELVGPTMQIVEYPHPKSFHYWAIKVFTSNEIGGMADGAEGFTVPWSFTTIGGGTYVNMSMSVSRNRGGTSTVRIKRIGQTFQIQSGAAPLLKEDGLDGRAVHQDNRHWFAPVTISD